MDTISKQLLSASKEIMRLNGEIHRLRDAIERHKLCIELGGSEAEGADDELYAVLERNTGKSSEDVWKDGY